MYTSEDIQVFVLSYNRAQYIEKTIISLLNQTVTGFPIIILDNGSTDNTEEVIKKYSYKNINFCPNKVNEGSFQNFRRAQELADKEWVMVHHDDDLLHPCYIEHVLKLINDDKTIQVICSGMVLDVDPSNNSWDEIDFQPRVYKNSSDFAALLYFGFPLPFSTVVYKTELFKTSQVRGDIYGKICDRPFIFDVMQDNKSAVLMGPYLKYRYHQGQDSTNSKTGPFINELFALHKKYKMLLTRSSFSYNWFVFYINNFRHVYKESLAVSKRDKISRWEYIKMAVKEGASSWGSVVVGILIFPIYKISRKLLRNKTRKVG